MKLLFVCPELDAGGAERHWASLLPALRARGVEVRLAAVNGGGRALEELRGQGIDCVEFGQSGVLGGLRTLPKLVAQRRWAPNAIVSWGYNAHSLSALTARAIQVPHVINWHRQPDFKGTRVQEGSTTLACRLGAGAIAVSASQKADLHAMGMPESRIRVVPNGVAAPNVAAGTREAIRAGLGVSDETLVLVLVARLRPEKMIDRFISAVAAASQRGADVVGVVVGDGPDREKLEGLASAAGAPIRFVGFQSEPAKYVIAGDAVALTSGFEALPMALIEAAAAGRAAVATDVGGTREIISDGETGLVVSGGDATGLVQAIEILAADPDKARAMGHLAKERWEQRFAFDTMVDRYVQLLAVVAGPPTAWSADAA